LRTALAAAEARAREVANDHDGRPYSEGGWYPPRRPSVLDQSVTQVRHESWQQKRYGAGSPDAASLDLPQPRDNGSPGPWNDPPDVLELVNGPRPHVRVDPESGMPIHKRRRPSVLPRMPHVVTSGSSPADQEAREHRLPRVGSSNSDQEPREHQLPRLVSSAADEVTDGEPSGEPQGELGAILHVHPRNRWQWL